MKNLLSFANVKNAVEQAIIASDVDNGTRGLTFDAVCITTHTAYQKESVELQKLMADALRANRLDEYQKYDKALQELPEPTVFTVWKLIKPLKDLKGTMVKVDKNVKYTLSMPTVEEVWISTVFMKAEAIVGEETGKKWKNPLNNSELPIVKLQLKKGIIDVYAPVRSWNGKELLPKRAMCTLMSLRAQQVTGELSARERAAQNRRYGFDAENI